MRTQAIAGAAAAALSQTVAYANERPQFGKPIGKFQAIQQNLAVMAGQVAAAQVSADMAAEALPLASTDPEAFLVTAAAAKSRASEAASIVAEIAHQAHGAMGFSHECRLHLATRRLWSARDEFGSESYWNEQLGRRVFDKGAEALWPYLTDIAGVAG